mmetsp:Transcript_21798/g.34169  ORF Transcript_21798/g.34169 Transcript_21798/m.34169 type:complete len:161 (-) Transcript_21798:76-558(-)
MFQPRCQAAILLTNPHQQVPEVVYKRWRQAFSEAGFEDVPVVATHSDVTQLFGPEEAAEFALKAQQHLEKVKVNPVGSSPQTIRLLENYIESPFPQKRRYMSELQGLDVLCITSSFAQDREQKSEQVGGVNMLLAGFVAATGGAVALINARSLFRRVFRR